MPPARIEPEKTALVVIDVQEKLAPAIFERETMTERALILIEAAKTVEVPILLTEHYPKGIGATIELVRKAAAGAPTFEKIHFDACREPDGLCQHLLAQNIGNAVLAGCEAHVCVMQTAFGIKNAGLQVTVAVDAVGSRFQFDKEVALQRMSASGVMPVTTEMIIFEWLERGDHPGFKTLLKKVKARKS